MNTHATIEEPVSKQLIGKNTTYMGIVRSSVFCGGCPEAIKRGCQAAEG
jgi:hypothetical protein